MRVIRLIFSFISGIGYGWFHLLGAEKGHWERGAFIAGVIDY